MLCYDLRACMQAGVLRVDDGRFVDVGQPCMIQRRPFLHTLLDTAWDNAFERIMLDGRRQFRQPSNLTQK